MIKSLTLFPKSIRPEKLDEIISKLTLDLKGADGLIEITSSDGHLMSPAGPPPYSRVIEASWESLEVFLAWAQSSARQEDKDFLLQSGAVLLYYEQKSL